MRTHTRTYTHTHIYTHTLTGQSKSKLVSNLPSEEKMAFSEKLNEFYCRYERNDVKENFYETIEELKAKGLVEGECDEVERSLVESTFRRLKIRKAAGPDNISARLLKTCTSQLSYAFCKLFNWSLNDSTVPSIWKHSVICPVPKNNKPSTLNDYRPVALTSIVMKCFEKVVLSRLVPRIQPHADPLQFAYKRDRGSDDATLTVLHHAFTHLDHKGSFGRILFIDFSSAFNTIQPHVLAHKLTQAGVNAKLVLWIVNFLVERTQKVHFQNFVSSSMTTSTGSPQGTVLSPFLFTLYTNDCRGTKEAPIIKYSDDSAILDLSNDNNYYFTEVAKFTEWCEMNYLMLNVSKTKELVIDFCQKPSYLPDLEATHRGHGEKRHQEACCPEEIVWNTLGCQLQDSKNRLHGSCPAFSGIWGQLLGDSCQDAHQQTGQSSEYRLEDNPWRHENHSYSWNGEDRWSWTTQGQETGQTSYPCRKDEEDARPPPAPKAQRPHKKQIEKKKSEPPSKRTAEGTRRHPYNRWTPVWKTDFKQLATRNPTCWDQNNHSWHHYKGKPKWSSFEGSGSGRDGQALSSSNLDIHLHQWLSWKRHKKWRLWCLHQAPRQASIICVSTWWDTVLKLQSWSPSTAECHRNHHFMGREAQESSLPHTHYQPCKPSCLMSLTQRKRSSQRTSTPSLKLPM